MSDDNLLIGGKPHPSVRVEIARSFSYRLNVGNYESRDFFASQKAECNEEDAELVSEALHDFCKRQVMKAVREFQDQNNFTRRTA